MDLTGKPTGPNSTVGIKYLTDKATRPFLAQGLRLYLEFMGGKTALQRPPKTPWAPGAPREVTDS